MTPEAVEYLVRGQIARIRMNRPDSLNALSEEMFRGLTEALTSASADKKVDFIVITGAGKAFSAGLDIKQVAGFESKDKAKRFVYNTVKPFWESFLSLGKPIIAAANGPAYGAGAEIALSADILIASERAVFAFSGGRVGALCCISPILGPLLMNGRKVVEMNLTGKPISAQEAERSGMVNTVVPENELEQITNQYIQEMLHVSPISNASFKRIQRDAISADSFRIAYRELLRTLTSEDFKKGSKAFVRKSRAEYYSAGLERSL